MNLGDFCWSSLDVNFIYWYAFQKYSTSFEIPWNLDRYNVRSSGNSFSLERILFIIRVLRDMKNKNWCGLVQKLRHCAYRRYSKMIDVAKCPRQCQFNIKVAINFLLVKTLTSVHRLRVHFFHSIFFPFHKTIQNGAGYKKVSFTPKLREKNNFAEVSI